MSHICPSCRRGRQSRDKEGPGRSQVGLGQAGLCACKGWSKGEWRWQQYTETYPSGRENQRGRGLVCVCSFCVPTMCGVKQWTVSDGWKTSTARCRADPTDIFPARDCSPDIYMQIPAKSSLVYRLSGLSQLCQMTNQCNSGQSCSLAAENKSLNETSRQWNLERRNCKKNKSETKYICF